MAELDYARRRLAVLRSLDATLARPAGREEWVGRLVTQLRHEASAAREDRDVTAEVQAEGFLRVVLDLCREE